MDDINSASFKIKPLLGSFIEQCIKLNHNSSTKMAVDENAVTVYKDEKYDKLFDVFLSQKGKNTEENDHCGIHLDELENLIEKLLEGIL